MVWGFLGPRGSGSAGLEHDRSGGASHRVPLPQGSLVMLVAALAPWLFLGCGGTVTKFPHLSICTHSRFLEEQLLACPGVVLSSLPWRGFNFGENPGAEGARCGCSVAHGACPSWGRDLVVLGESAPMSPSGFLSG